jgi:amidase
LVSPSVRDGADAREAAGGPRPLDAETVAVKDLFAVEGFAIGAGIPEYLQGAPRSETTAPAVQALLDAGAAIRGIAQTDEFAYSIAGRNVHYGTPPNPRVTGAIPGGSSSGPGAAVALGHASLGLGTDTGGSIRVPASYQGLWGLRTTHGAVSREQLLPLAPSFDTVGWLTREPRVLRAAAAASLPAEEQSPLEDARFAVSSRLLFAADDLVQASFVGVVDRLERAGRISAPDLVDVGDPAELFAAFRTVQAAEAWATHGDWVTAHPGVLGADIAGRFEFASRITADEEAAARRAVADALARLDNTLDGRILLLPSTSSAAPQLTADAAEIDAVRTGTMSLTCVAGIGGYPALSVPVLEAAGAPVGLCLVGPRFTDLALIDLAASFLT